MESDVPFNKRLAKNAQWLRAYLLKVVPTSEMARELHDHVEFLLDAIVSLAYGEPSQLGCLYGGKIGTCFHGDEETGGVGVRETPCNPCTLSFSIFALQHIEGKADTNPDAVDLSKMFVAMDKARRGRERMFRDIEAYERVLKDWVEQITPIPKPVDPDEEDRSGSCYIPKTTVAEMRDWLKAKGPRAKSNLPPPNRRCLNCGRTWYDAGDTVADGHCLQCGAGPNDWERAPDGIDFRSQHTEAGKPHG